MSHKTNPFCMQSLVFNTQGKPAGVKELYYKGDFIYPHHNGIAIDRGGSLDLFTYFNLFNLDKWSKYASVHNLLLHLNVHGTVRIIISRHTLNKRNKDPVYDNTLTLQGSVWIPVPHEGSGGLYSVELRAGKKSIVHHGGWYTHPLPGSITPPRVALIICTYKRELYLFRTLNVLRTYLPLHWNVFIVDNGRTIPDRIITEYDERFHFFRNPNTGGSGGFTRGLIEVMKHHEKWTHALFMDDDVIIEPAALERTQSFINIMRPEYKQHFISGAMLRLDSSCIQHESGAFWNGVRVKHCKHNYDLTNTMKILKNESESQGPHHYAAWWYCVVPITENLKNNLPVPLFVNGDDIEYSMRSSEGIICLNGVTIWHEPFHIKYNPVKQHYLAVRNGLIINTRHNFSLIRSLALVYLRFVYLLLKGNKPGAALVLNGFADFLKGSRFLLANKQEQMFRKNNSGLFRETCRVSTLLRLTIRFFLKYVQIKKDYKNIPLTSTYWYYINKSEGNASQSGKPEGSDSNRIKSEGSTSQRMVSERKISEKEIP